ncbi:hypothetical protein N0V88_001679 [Collariella sp. IMI 366227]|nr:hypothetical protein N0V88_001679 [Collariella sp. IMI 366227]
METINKLANTASKAIWGEGQTQEEPVSGKMGNTAAGEPYDAGNIEPKEAAVSSTTGQETTENRTTLNKDHDTPHQPPPTIRSQTLPHHPLVNPAEKQSALPTATAPSAVGMTGDSTHAQNDTRPPPTAEEHKAAKDVSGLPGASEAGKKSSEDVTLTGPGPRPLEEIAREHGGDAGAVATTTGVETEGAGGQRRDSGKSLGEEEGGNKLGGGDASGTGEEYIKSTGLNADGGDFDASRAGAGKEADRLLEQKGVNRVSDEHRRHGHHEEAAAAGHQHQAHEAGQEHKEKVSLKDKIKAKLHKSSTSA